MKKIIFYIFFKILLILNKISSNKLLYKICSSFLKISYVEKKILSNNLKFFVPNSLSNWRVENFFNSEPETLEWIDSFSEDKKVIFWDIGANIGLYSLYAAIKFKNIDVTSFEPSTNNLRILSRNISLNNLEDKIKISQFPLSDKINCYELMNESEFIEGYSMSSYSYESNFEGNLIQAKNKYRLYGTSINYLIEHKILNIPNYIKIDVDGIEHKILQGASQVLSNENLKGLLIEINENYEEQFKSILDIMLKYNFKLKFKKQSKLEMNKNFEKTFNYVFERKR
jgi:FkbM family methyltransferase